MFSELNEYTYEIRELTSVFYRDYPNPPFQEIIRKPNRPYDIIVFKTNDDFCIGIPFRTKMKHNIGHHFYSKSLPNGDNPGIDYSKMVIIKNPNYIGKLKLIDSYQMTNFLQNIATIHREAFEYLSKYVNHIKGIHLLDRSEFRRNYQYCCLKYFHNELGI